MRGPGEILVVSCYELGRQPVAAAGALAALEGAGFAPAAQDVAVEKLSEQALRAARLGPLQPLEKDGRHRQRQPEHDVARVPGPCLGGCREH